MTEQCHPWKSLEACAAHSGPIREPWFTWGPDGRRLDDMGAEKAGRSDGFLEFLGSAKSNLLAGLDLDGLAGRWVASHAGGAMPDLQDAQAD